MSGTASCCGLPFRQGTIHWATEAKARHIRVFPTDSSIAVTSQILHDTTITIQANKNITLMLVGSRAAGGSVHFVQIDDDPSPAATEVGVRLVNATTTAPGAASGYITTDTTSALPGTSTFASVAPLSASLADQPVIRVAPPDALPERALDPLVRGRDPGPVGLAGEAQVAAEVAEGDLVGLVAGLEREGEPPA